MPKEPKKRGRREEKKRKRETFTGENAIPIKRRRSQDAEEEPPETEVAPEFIKLDTQLQVEQLHKSEGNQRETPFYGLLDEEEQAYYKRADNLLEVNQFANSEERDLFIANVYREASGKELKIANSQSCSRFLERLIVMSKPYQLKTLFRKFSGHFLQLVQHRFASHCCEALFLNSAPIVTQELIAPPEEVTKAMESEEVYISMEDTFLYTLNELKGNLGYLMTDRFASHVLRVLLIVLSGRPLSNVSTDSLLQSKKKEKIEVFNQTHTQSSFENRTVPESFTGALKQMVSGTMAGLDTNYLRALAVHPIANPVLQLLIELELSGSGKPKAKDEKSLFRTMLPDDPITPESTSTSFLKGLLYDPVGSRLLETIIRNTPGRTFKPIYQSLFRENIAQVTKNETAGYVVGRVLERLSREDLRHAVEQLCPQIPNLIQRSRTSIIKTAIERCYVRELDTQNIADALKIGYGSESSKMVRVILKLDDSSSKAMAPERKAQLEAQDTGKFHGSLLAQAMLKAPSPLRNMITEGLLALDPSLLLQIAKDRSATYALQGSMTCAGQTKPFRRRMLQLFAGHAADLALDPIGSHVLNVFWSVMGDVHFIRENIAEELRSSEQELRQSFSGRIVWRNWNMDLYKRRKTQWIDEAKYTEVTEEMVTSKNGEEDMKSGKRTIEQARKRFAAAKAGKENFSQGFRGGLGGGGEGGIWG